VNTTKLYEPITKGSKTKDFSRWSKWQGNLGTRRGRWL